MSEMAEGVARESVLGQALRSNLLGLDRRLYVFTDGKGYTADRESMTETEANYRNSAAELFAIRNPNASELRWKLEEDASHPCRTTALEAMERIQVTSIVPPSVLDACCGPRMFWFVRADPRTLYLDNRRQTYPIDIGTPGTIGRNPIVISPDVMGDFSAMPFPDESFHLVVFDPPHVERDEALGVVTRKYGHLKGNWREMLRKGFEECFRVLKPNGVLVFKWGESQFRLAEILKLAPAQPLFGQKTSKTTHWCVFMKAAA